MLKDFQIASGIAFESGDLSLDVYNMYHLVDINYSDKLRFVKVTFESNDIQAAIVEPERFYVEFLNVSYFNIKLDKIIGDDIIVDEIGYKSRGDDDFNWLLQEGQQRPVDDFILRISSEGHLRIKAKRARVVVTR